MTANKEIEVFFRLHTTYQIFLLHGRRVRAYCILINLNACKIQEAILKCILMNSNLIITSAKVHHKSRNTLHIDIK